MCTCSFLTLNSVALNRSRVPLLFDICWLLHRIKDLSRIHQPKRIKRPFQAPHYINSIKSQLFNHRLFLAQANTMLTGLFITLARSFMAGHALHRLTQVPSSRMAWLTMWWTTSSTRVRSAGSLLLYNTDVWKLPSPTWPTTLANRPKLEISRLASSVPMSAPWWQSLQCGAFCRVTYLQRQATVRWGPQHQSTRFHHHPAATTAYSKGILSSLSTDHVPLDPSSHI